MKKIILTGLIVVGMISTFAEGAYADSVWSWGQGNPELTDYSEMTDPNSSDCPTGLQTLQVVGEVNRQSVCMASNDSTHIRLGTYQKYGSGTTYVIGFVNSSILYPFYGCSGLHDCLYSAAHDELIVRAHFISSATFSLYTFDHFSTRLVRNNQSNGDDFYSFNGAQPDYIYQNSDGYQWPVGGIGLSTNGRWLAVELRERGFSIIDLDTQQTRRLNMVATTDENSEPQASIAITNDGRTIAMAGRVAPSIISAKDDCGGSFSAIEEMDAITHECPIVPLPLGKWIDDFFNSKTPFFSDDGGLLTNVLVKPNGQAWRLTLHPEGYNLQQLPYLALGDSFTSGEGETSDSYYQLHTNDKDEKCHVSTRSYPYLVGALNSLSADQVHNVACSGARIEDVMGDATDYLGQGSRLGTDGLALTDTEIVSQRDAALINFIPGEILQDAFVNRYQPLAVSVGIGGNDAGMFDKLQACIMPGTCSWATDDGRRQAGREIKALFDKLVSVYKDIQQMVPNARFFVVGYPKIIDQNSSSCDLITDLLIDHTEREFMNEAVGYLNQVIAAAARQVGAQYISVENAFSGHQLCDKTNEPAMNGLRLGDDVAPISALNWLKLFGDETFHPTPYGFQLLAGAVAQQMGPLLTSSDTATLPPSEKSSTDTDLSEPAYWDDDGRVLPQTVSQPIVSNTLLSGVTPTLGVQLPSATFLPNSSVSIEIHSTEVQTSSATTDSTGALHNAIILGAETEDGFHTIHIIGSSFTGEAVDYYQTIEYIRNPSTDTQVNNTTVISPIIPSREIGDDNTLFGMDLGLKRTGGTVNSTGKTVASIVQVSPVGAVVSSTGVLGAMSPEQPTNITAIQALPLSVRTPISWEKFIIDAACALIGIFILLTLILWIRRSGRR